MGTDFGRIVKFWHFLGLLDLPLPPYVPKPYFVYLRVTHYYSFYKKYEYLYYIIVIVDEKVIRNAILAISLFEQISNSHWSIKMYHLPQFLLFLKIIFFAFSNEICRKVFSVLFLFWGPFIFYIFWPNRNGEQNLFSVPAFLDSFQYLIQYISLIT